MARPGNQDMSRRRRQFEKMTKADFVSACEDNGWTVRQERRVREGWNDSQATFVVMGEREVEVFDKMRSERVDWNDCFTAAERFAAQ